jgi:hypothetical protein
MLFPAVKNDWLRPVSTSERATNTLKGQFQAPFFILLEQKLANTKSGTATHLVINHVTTPCVSSLKLPVELCDTRYDVTMAKPGA